MTGQVLFRCIRGAAAEPKRAGSIYATTAEEHRAMRAVDEHSDRRWVPGPALACPNGQPIAPQRLPGGGLILERHDASLETAQPRDLEEGSDG